MVVQLQGLGVGHVQSFFSGERVHDALGAGVARVVMPWIGHAVVGLRGVVGRIHEATFWVDRLGVHLKAMPDLDVVGRVASVDRDLGVDVLGADRKLGRRNPCDVALGIAVHHVEARRMNQLGVGLERLEARLSREPVERLVDAVFGMLSKGPPHRQAILQQRPMVRRTHLEDHVGLACHLDGFETKIQGKPLPIMQVGVAFQRLPVKVDFIVHEHRGAPRVSRECPMTGNGMPPMWLP